MPASPIVIHELDPDLSPWERQPGEPESAWSTFLAYRDLGEERSIAAAVASVGRWRNSGDRWSAAWQWRIRAEAYDRHLDAVTVKTAMAERRKMAARHAGLASGALGAMQTVVAEFVRRMGSVEMQAALTAMSPKQLLDFIRSSSSAIKEMVYVERLSRGAPTDATVLASTTTTTTTATTLTAALDAALERAGYSDAAHTAADLDPQETA